VVLGVCGVKSGGEGVLGTLAGVSSKHRLGIGDGDVLLSASLILQFLEHRCRGFIISLEDMSLPRSESEWIILSIGFFSYTPPR
jgi:hypothetical protein